MGWPAGSSEADPSTTESVGGPAGSSGAATEVPSRAFISWTFDVCVCVCVVICIVAGVYNDVDGTNECMREKEQEAKNYSHILMEKSEVHSNIFY